MNPALVTPSWCRSLVRLTPSMSEVGEISRIERDADQQTVPQF
jgi:hypothetical protein